MKTEQFVEDKINPIIKNAKKDKEVLAVALFGSFARKEPHRDIDICLFLKKKISNSEMTKKRLKFMSSSYNNLDIQIFQQLPLYIRVRILKEGKILLVKNEPALYELAFQTIREFESYKKLYYMYLKEVENGPRESIVKI